MTYKKHFKAHSLYGQMSPISGASMEHWNHGRPNTVKPKSTNPDFGYQAYKNKLPEVYTGHPNRIERYQQYEMMDYDSEINACLDIIAEFSTRQNISNHTPFEFVWNEEPTQHEVSILQKQLQQWCNLNEFNQRAFKLFRNTLKYGDQLLVRDPETFKLYWVDMCKVTKVIVNESEGKEPEQYVIRDLNPNLSNLSITQKTTSDFQSMPPAAGYNASYSYNAPNDNSGTGASRFNQAMDECAIDAKHIVHLSLTEGLDKFWPFGQSVLENIFKVYKQKELLEDAILIYRIQRAPERRIFKIDTGDLPSHLAMAHVERIKNEIHQRRIPSVGSGNIMDATYNPMSTLEDYYFPQSADGRGSSVEVLPGGANLSEIDDLRFFNNKLARGLRVPSSYLPSGPEDSPAAMNDGRVGTAMIQEFRFNQYCERLQNYICDKLDREFKMFMRWRGFNIDSGLFNIKFNAPQNFAAYRQSELDKDRISIFQAVDAIPYISKRFAMERFLGLTKDEIKQNAVMWDEEHEVNAEAKVIGADLRNIGISPGDLNNDIAASDAMMNTDTDTEAPPTPDDLGLGATLPAATEQLPVAGAE